MKKIFTLLSAFVCLAIVNLYAQTPLVLTQSNFGKLSTYNQSSPTNLSTITFAGANLNYDYDSLLLSPVGTLVYQPATDPFFASKCDVYYEGILAAKNFYYYANYYFTTNAIEHSENGIHIPYQGTSQTAVTGGANDSIIFYDQKILLSQPRTILKFPASVGYRNTVKSRRAINFDITVGAYGLNHAPAQHVSTLYREDTIVGWGKMRIHTANGPSIYYDVLSMFSMQHNIDSFYLNGMPAPTTLLNAFGEQQGQHTNDKNRIYYFRANRAQTLMLVTLDSALTAFTGVYFDADSIKLASGVEQAINKNDFASFLYPNPSNGAEINLQFINTNIASANYVITDISGKIVASNYQSLNNNLLKINLSKSITNGIYFIHVTDDKNNSIAAEQFSVQQ
jgi:hypothetical protein